MLRFRLLIAAFGVGGAVDWGDSAQLEELFGLIRIKRQRRVGLSITIYHMSREIAREI